MFRNQSGLRYVFHLTGRKATVTTAVATSPLTASDRCDRCGAQAYLRVQLASGGELLFCAHHAREHGEKLRTIAVNVHDETSKLLDRPTTD
jgi:hypothetical protein